MSRPYPTTFEKEQSPMTPVSASSSQTPISYKANVNRQKTKKWADAKPASYGGDDWGDDDEYDLPPPPVSKPTGLRQPGQALHGGQKPESPIVDNKKSYGDLPPLPKADDDTPRPRANSFDADDEKRNFSSGIQQQPSPASAPAPVPSHAPPTRFSQITGQPSTRDPSGPPALSITTQLPAPAAVTGLRKANAETPSSNSPHPDVLLPGKTNSSETSSVISPTSSAARTPSIDFQARRDYSPSAVPPPLHTRGSPAPQAPNSPAARFPTRKSSLSQSSGPELSDLGQPQELHGSQPHLAELSSPPPTSTPKSPIAQGKALPFIRPADIYKRAEEERKTRESMDSGRPSMDSIVGSRGERSESPAGRPLREKSSSDSLSGRRRISTDGDDTDSGRLRPMLEPVRERKSEYGFEGFNAQDHAPQVETHQEGKLSDREALEVEDERRQSTSPKLPDLNRISGFGMDLFTKPTQDSIHPAFQSEDVKPTTENSSLQKQDSTGFKSVVHQAFDREGESSVPDTPASRTSSGIKRTDSESTGTTGISPIISRVPSTSAHEARARDGVQPSVLESVKESDASTPGEPVVSLPVDEHATPTQPAFKPGHRRDISTPSPNNSPARTPDLSNSQVVPSQEAVIADPSSASSTGDDDQLLPPRPIVDREQSFRPNLPGGWTSYANTDRSGSSQGDGHPTIEAQRSQTPTLDRSSTPGQVENDPLDVTPTASKPPLSAHTSEAAASGLVPTDSVKDESDSESENEWDDSPVRSPQVQNTTTQGSEQNQHVPILALDPLDIPKLEHAPAETQLRPDTIHREISAESSEAPPPPAKDTPKDTEDISSNYFAHSSVDTSPKAPIDVEEEKLASETRPQIVPTLTMDSQPDDEENEKLRNEIIQSLSPKPSASSARDENMLSDQIDDEVPSNHARISSYLPSEYDNYWASTNDEEAATAVTAPAINEPEPSSEPELPANVTVSPPIDPEQGDSSISNSASRDGQTLRPSMHPQRFSWERSTEDVSALPLQKESSDSRSDEHQSRGEEKIVSEPIEAAQPTIQSPLGSHPTSDHSQRDAGLIAGGAALAGAGAAAYAYGSQTQGQSGRRLSLAEEKDPQVSSYPISPSPPQDQHPANSTEPHLSPNPDHLNEHYAPSGVSAPSASSLHSVPISSVSPINSPTVPQFSPQPSKLLPFKEIAAIKNSHERTQKFDQTRHEFAIMDYGLSNWISTMMAQQPEHADASPSFAGSRASFPIGSGRGKFSKGSGANPPPLQQPYYQQYLNASSPTTPGTPVPKPGPNTPIGSQHGLSSTSNKITSQQVQAKGKELLHTAGIFGGKAGKAGKGLLAKGKSRLRAAGTSGDKTSSTSSISNSSPPRNPPTTPPAPSSSQSKPDRRTSWGLPLALSRSSHQSQHQHTASSQTNSSHTTTSTATNHPPPNFPRQRATTLTLDTTSQPRNLNDPFSAQTDDDYAVMSAPGILDNLDTQRAMSGALPANEGLYGVRLVDGEVDDRLEGQRRESLREGEQRDIPQQHIAQQLVAPNRASQEIHQTSNAPTSVSQQPASLQDTDAIHSRESNGNLSPPAPIGKHQPSWDPYNATPIVEEETYTWDEQRANQSTNEGQSFQPLTENKNLAMGVPAQNKPLSERSDSGDVVFHDARDKARTPTPDVRGEAKDDLRDWVIVPESTEVRNVPEEAGVVVSGMEKHVGTQIDPHIQREDIPAQQRSQVDISAKSQTEPKVEPQIYAAPLAPTVIASEPEPQQAQTLEIPPPTMTDLRSGSYSIGTTATNTSLGVTNRPRGSTSNSILDRPRYSYDVPRATENSPPQVQQKPTPPVYQKPAPVITSFEHSKPQYLEDEPQTSTSFKGLPPIRRTSTFGIGFGSRRSKQRFAIEDEEEETPEVPPLPLPTSQTEPELPTFEKEEEHTGFGGEAPVNPDAYWKAHRPHASSISAAMPPPIPPFDERPSVPYSGSSDQPQHVAGMYNAPRALDPHVDSIIRSQEGWRPDLVTPTTQGPSFASPGQWSETTVSPMRPSPDQRRGSLEPQRNRTPSFSREPDVLYNERMGRTVLNPQGRPYETPPSSAQRYPDLFRSGQTAADGPRDPADLPAHYYQAPITREAAFLPRQQTNEYQLQGVGPPADEPRPSSRRNSGIFRDLGNKIRSASRERSNSISQDQNLYDKEQNEYAESSAPSEDTQGRQKRRNSFFGIHRASTAGMAPPQSRESMVAHPASRVDLLSSTQPSPITSPHERKRSFFGNINNDILTPKSNKLARASTSVVSDEPGKKKRFSNLTSMFKNTSKDAPSPKPSPRPQATRELSQFERQPIDSPAPSQQHFTNLPAPAPPQSQAHAYAQVQNPQTQQRGFLNKLSPDLGADPSQPRPDSTRTRSGGLLGGWKAYDASRLREEPKSRSNSDLKPRPEGKSRSSTGLLSVFSGTGSEPSQHEGKPESKHRSSIGLLSGLKNSDPSQPHESKTRKMSQSTGALLGGIMGRRSAQLEKRDDSSSQGTRSQNSQQQYHPNQVPPAQTYSDIQENPTPTTQPPSNATRDQNVPWRGQTITQIQSGAGQQQQQGQQSLGRSMLSQQRPSQPPPSQQPQRDPRGEIERGRRQDREPRYDSVPIPGGYSLVRGQGAVPVPTDYDPRGLRRLQQNGPPFSEEAQARQDVAPDRRPAHINTQQQPGPNRASPQTAIQHRSLEKSPPNLAPVDTFDNTKRSSRRLSREDLLARSPAREPQGQQRPYQLSLPDDEDGRPTLHDKEAPVISPPASIRAVQTPPIKLPAAPNPTIQRLSQPMLRHPQSPAGYPLPDDTVFSPINPSANSFPPPPPPKWPSHLDNTDHHHLNIASDLNRSISGISQVSHLSTQQKHDDMLAPMDALDKETGGRDITPSPTPPTPVVTPPPATNSRNHNSLTMNTASSNRGQSPDLYNASPRLPKIANDLSLGGGNGNGSGQPVLDERERARRVASAQEEKIFYDKDRLGAEHDDVEEEVGPAAMSATSYPGQEWNPYAGVYEDDY